MNTEGIRTQGCKICVMPEAEEYEKAYFNKTLTVEEITKEIHVNNYTFYKHIRDHVKPDTAMTINGSALVLADEVIDKQGSIIDILETLKKHADKVTLLLDGDLDINTVKAFTMLIGELRRNIKLLAELQGEFKINEPRTVTNNYNIEYTQVVEKIMQVACQNCKPKFAEELKPIIKVIKHED